MKPENNEEQGLNLYIFPKGTNLIDFYSINKPNISGIYVGILAESGLLMQYVI